MEDQEIERVESVETINGEIKVVLYIDPKKFSQSMIPNYTLQEKVQKEILPVIVDEILKERKEEIKKEVLEKVDWPELVRSEIVQKTIKDIAGRY